MGHWLHCLFELPLDAFRGSASFCCVPFKAAFVADFVGGSDVESQLEQRPEFGPVQGEEPFQDHQFAWFDDLVSGCAGVGGEVIEGGVDRAAGGQFSRIGENLN